LPLGHGPLALILLGGKTNPGAVQISLPQSSTARQAQSILWEEGYSALPTAGNSAACPFYGTPVGADRVWVEEPLSWASPARGFGSFGSATSQPTASAQGRSCIRQIWGAAKPSHQKLQGLRLSLAAGLVDATEPGRLDGEPRLAVKGRRPYSPSAPAIGLRRSTATGPLS
jgi:hypothetical protein